ncbi:hypothetical protein ACFLSQ_07065 [Bacteroidota bacterium]
MQTIEAIYDHGRLIFLGDPLKIKAKVKLTILEDLSADKKNIKFPEMSLGKIKKTDRKELYEEYLSD